MPRGRVSPRDEWRWPEESAGDFSYREEYGPFKTVEDLKQVPGWAIRWWNVIWRY